MERNDFISGDAYYRYKFERESKNEEIQRLRTKMERMRTDNYVRVAYDSPYEYYEKYSIRRYGFHGTSHRYVTARYGKIKGGLRTIHEEGRR